MKNKELLIIGILIAIVVFGKSSSFQAIIGAPEVSFVYDWDKDAPPQKPFSIGTDTFEVNPVEFTCTMDDRYRAPEPRENCWKTKTKFQGKETEFIYGEKKPVNDYLKVKWTANSDIRRPDDDHPTYYLDSDYQSYYIFSIYNDDFLESKIIEDSTIVALNADETAEIEVRNNLANNLQGGLVIYTSHQKMNNIPAIKTIPMTFKKGVNTYTLSLDTSILGQMTLQIRPFIKIAEREFHDDRVSSAVYNVLPKIEDVETSVDCTLEECPAGFHCEKMFYESKEYNICVKGELPKVGEISYEKEINAGFILIIVALFALILIMGLKYAGKIK